jgi:hypothetical protein
MGAIPDDATVMRVIDHVILPAVSHTAAPTGLTNKAGDPGRSPSSAKKKARTP